MVSDPTCVPVVFLAANAAFEALFGILQPVNAPLEPKRFNSGTLSRGFEVRSSNKITSGGGKANQRDGAVSKHRPMDRIVVAVKTRVARAAEPRRGGVGIGVGHRVDRDARQQWSS